jgi:hypothetical protein
MRVKIVVRKDRGEDDDGPQDLDKEADEDGKSQPCKCLPSS